MPVIVAQAVRYLIIAAVQLGIFSLAEKIIMPMLNAAIEAIAKAFGATDEQAKDILANEVLQFAESIGIFALTLRTKLPIKVAELLGFSTKGWTLRKLPDALAKIVGTGSKTAATSAVMTAASAEKGLEVIAKSRGLSLSTVKGLYNSILESVGKHAMVILVAAQLMDFANWQGAYQYTFQRIFTAFGFPPDKKLPRANTVSDDTWKRISAVIEELKPIGISFPFSGKSTAYSKDRLVDLVNEVAATIIKDGGDATFKNVMAIVLPLIQLPDGTSGKTSTTSSTAPKAPTAQAATVKVFTGVVSQGNLGAPVEFVPRDNDIIESGEELLDSAQNNLAPFIAGIFGRISYELKIVSSVVSKDGFRQTGTTQRIISSYNKDGSPRYKTVTNKFATLDIFVMSDKRVRTKIATIVLGPVDSAHLQLSASQVGAIAESIKENIFTSDIAELSGIVTSAPFTVLTPAPENASSAFMAPAAQKPVRKITPRGYFVNYDQFFTQVFYQDGDHLVVSPDFQTVLTDEEKSKLGSYGAQVGEAIKRLKLEGYPVDTFPHKIFHNEIDGKPARQVAAKTFDEFFGATLETQESQGTASLPPAALSAQTLFDFFNAQSKPLPGVGERSKLYESLGLGLAAYYTGTAEQNTKLLRSLQGK